jgi:large subunit ribosomal protein L22
MAGIEVRAQAKYISRSPRKMRPIADAIRGMKANLALANLKYMAKGGAADIYKVVASAVANATNNARMNADKLVISQIMIDVAPTFKRSRAESKGRSRRILKRNSHITVFVQEPGTDPVKPAKVAAAKAEIAGKTEAKETKTQPKADSPMAKTKSTKFKAK